MKSIENLKSGFLWMLAAMMMVTTSCKDDVTGPEEFEEGLPVSVAFSITTPNPGEVQSRATDAQETNVEKLALFFYKNDTSLPVAYEVPDSEIGNPKVGSSTTNYFYSITIPESVGLTSGHWYVYAVANWHKGFWDKNMSFSDFAKLTKKEMDEYTIRKSVSTVDITETSILLTGKYKDPTTHDDKLALKPGVNKLAAALHLRRSIAKISFNFEEGPGVYFVPETYDIYNYSRSSTLMERSGWKGASGTDPGDLHWMGRGNIADEGNFNSGKGIPITADHIEFYMPENVQQAKVKDFGGKGGKELREKKGADGKFLYAPDYGTYIVVHGRYRGPGDGKNEVTAFVHYTIHLGDFSAASRDFDNYTVRRNTKYNYKVTVKGVEDIIVEAKTDTENNPGAEGDVIHTGGDNTKLLDSHYETCIISFPQNVIENVTSFGVVVRTPKTTLLNESVTEEVLKGADINWIKFGKPAGTGAHAAYPQNGTGLYNLAELLNSFKDKSYSQKFLVSGNNVYLQAYVDEYYYSDLDPGKFVNAHNREMTLAYGTHVSSDKNSTYTETPVFSIVQRSIASVFNLSTSNPFGMEIDENGQASWATKAKPIADPVMLNKEGSDNAQGSDMWNGYTNTMGNIKVGDRWDTYIDVAANKMKPKYNYGIYQFLIRNRDENGDGIIQQEELKWFIPSLNQHNAIWAGYHALSEETILDTGLLYFSSTNGANRTFWAIEGVFGEYKTSDHGGKNYVRCIRSLKSYNASTTHLSNYDRATRVISISGFGPNALRQSGSQVGEYLFHPQNDVSNKLPQAFKIAKSYLKNVKIGGRVGDEYVPTVNIISQTEKEEGTWTKNVTFTIKFKITREGNHKYYWNTTEGFSGAHEIIGEEAMVEVKGHYPLTGAMSRTQSIWILADNGNFVTLKADDDRSNPSVKQQSIVAESNRPIAPAIKSRFTPTEISTLDLCKDYSEEADGSDKGQWRIPNQRELLVMFMHSTNVGSSDGDYRLNPGTACRTFYNGRATWLDGIFFIQNPGTFITSDNGENPFSDFEILPVRDYVPASQSAAGRSATH